MRGYCGSCMPTRLSDHAVREIVADMVGPRPGRDSSRRVLNLDGRRQTRKFRATVPAGGRMAGVLNATD
jgi:hypothetical protein